MPPDTPQRLVFEASVERVGRVAQRATISGDNEAAKELRAFEIRNYQIVTDDPDEAIKWEDVYDRRDDREKRRVYGNRFFITVLAWLAIVLVIVVLAGSGALTLPSEVMVALLGTTSVNVIGLLLAVALYLFPKRG